MEQISKLKIKARIKRMGLKAIPDNVLDKIASMSEKVGITKAIKASMRSATACTKIYNEACVVCKQKLIRTPGMPEEDYCNECRPLIKKHLGDDAE